eukprot:9165726-Pyramimonas_sp.AAC.1
MSTLTKPHLVRQPGRHQHIRLVIVGPLFLPPVALPHLPATPALWPLPSSPRYSCSRSRVRLGMAVWG